MNSALREGILAEIEHMRDKCGLLAVKAEFEAEGSRAEELVMLADLVRRANVPLTIKIGGCEAARDMDQARLFDAESIMAPMIESPYAMGKFRKTAEKVFECDVARVDWVINAETRTCHENLDAILAEGDGFLTTVCIGRSDYSGSLGLSGRINGEEVFAGVRDIAERSRAAGLRVTFGGKVTADAVGFASRMAPHVDAYETRKATFASRGDEGSIAESIEHALRFETLYLQLKRAYYLHMSREDEARLARFGGPARDGAAGRHG